MKTCSACKVSMEVSNFFKDKYKKDGLGSQCKLCHKKSCANWDRTLYITDYMKKYRSKNKEKCNSIRKKYVNHNKAECYKKTQIYIKNRVKTDPQFKLRTLLRSRLSAALRNKAKQGSSVRDLGMSIKDFLVYLNVDCFHRYGIPYTGNEKLFHIDHIRPLASFDLTNKEELLKAIRWDNLQVLTVEQNLSKGAKL